MPDFSRVKFVFLFGSYSQDKENKMSDIDFAIYYEGSEDERYNFRKEILGKLSDNFDVHVFQDLPLYIRIKVLSAKLIYSKNIKFVYNVAYQTIKDFDRFKKYYQSYIDSRRLRV
jgi:predicted nucleotidyltransferase